MRWVENVTCVGEKRNGYIVFIRKAERKRTIDRIRCRWNSNIKIGFKEITCKDVDLMLLDKGGVQWWGLTNIVMQLQVL
jgi:hypothetical protein